MYEYKQENDHYDYKKKYNSYKNDEELIKEKKSGKYNILFYQKFIRENPMNNNNKQYIYRVSINDNKNKEKDCIYFSEVDNLTNKFYDEALEYFENIENRNEIFDKKSDIDLKILLNAIDNNDYDWYDNLTKNEQKSLSPWLAMRWTSAVNNLKDKDISKLYLECTNDFVNVNFSKLYSHPSLQFKLLCMIGCGKQYHYWLSPPNNEEGFNNIQKCVKYIYKHYNIREFELFFKKNTTEDIIKILKGRGISDASLKKLNRKGNLPEKDLSKIIREIV